MEASDRLLRSFRRWPLEKKNAANLHAPRKPMNETALIWPQKISRHLNETATFFFFSRFPLLRWSDCVEKRADCGWKTQKWAASAPASANQMQWHISFVVSINEIVRSFQSISWQNLMKQGGVSGYCLPPQKKTSAELGRSVTGQLSLVSGQECCADRIQVDGIGEIRQIWKFFGRRPKSLAA